MKKFVPIVIATATLALLAVAAVFGYGFWQGCSMKPIIAETMHRFEMPDNVPPDPDLRPQNERGKPNLIGMTGYVADDAEAEKKVAQLISTKQYQMAFMTLLTRPTGIWTAKNYEQLATCYADCGDKKQAAIALAVAADKSFPQGTSGDTGTRYLKAVADEKFETHDYSGFVYTSGYALGRQKLADALTSASHIDDQRTKK